MITMIITGTIMIDIMIIQTMMMDLGVGGKNSYDDEENEKNKMIIVTIMMSMKVGILIIKTMMIMIMNLMLKLTKVFPTLLELKLDPEFCPVH